MKVQQQFRYDPFAAIRLLADEEQYRADLAQATAALYRKKSIPERIRFAIIVIAVFLLSILFLNAWPANADTLTAKEIAQQIKQGSVLSLHQNVAAFWADNLLAAQDPSVCDYCANEPDSIPLGIAAMLKAIRIEADPLYGAGLTFCNLTNCIIANTQSTIAIDDRAGITITPSSLDFGEVPVVSTPEPSVLLLMFAPLALLALKKKP